ncbi:MAG: M56 family metallopeptidase [Planctomycetaceae bacterium]
MSAFSNFLGSRTIELLGAGLFHFVWEGACLALLLLVALRNLRGASPEIRYFVACTALALMALCPSLTITWLSANEQAKLFTFRQANESTNESALRGDVYDSSDSTSLPKTSSPRPPARDAHEDATENAAASDSASPARRLFAGIARPLSPSIPWFVSLWLAGVTLLSIRLSLGWLWVERVRRGPHQPAAANWQSALRKLSARLGMGHTVRLVDTSLVEIPSVIGWLQPVILFPAGALVGLTTPQVEALLAHELAHVRRHDYLANLLQTCVESFLFYHPAVWWVSSVIREEREHCCDDLAIAVCGDRTAYALALAVMEELRAGTPALAAAASGGSLLKRNRRIAGAPEAGVRGMVIGPKGGSR